MEDLLHPITDFRELGTGHKRERVYAINEKGRIRSNARVLHNNCRSRKTVEFDNGKLFDTISEKMDGEKVSLCFPTEKLDEKWEKQRKLEAIVKWIDEKLPPDTFALLDCVAIIRELPEPKYWRFPPNRHEWLCSYAKKRIRHDLEDLNLRELRRLTGILIISD
jgi:hypothetical protein